MTLTTINQAANDQALLDRIEAATWQEVIGNAAFGDSAFGRFVRGGGGGNAIRTTFGYPVAVDYAEEYGYAVDNGNPNPGGDVGVISYANVSAAVQVHWPWGADETPPEATP